MLTRRAALRGGTAVAASAAVGMVAAPAAAEDGEVFALVEERGRARKLQNVASGRWREAVKSLMPPGLRMTDVFEPGSDGGAMGAYIEIAARPEIKALSAEMGRREDVRQGLSKRLAATPARTLEGIHAKLQASILVGEGGRGINTAIALSGADDLARLIGKA